MYQLPDDSDGGDYVDKYAQPPQNNDHADSVVGSQLAQSYGQKDLLNGDDDNYEDDQFQAESPEKT